MDLERSAQEHPLKDDIQRLEGALGAMESNLQAIERSLRAIEEQNSDKSAPMAKHLKHISSMADWCAAAALIYIASAAWSFFK